MNITVQMCEEHNKCIVTIECGFEVKQFTLYDMTIVEIANFIKTIIE